MWEREVSFWFRYKPSSFSWAIPALDGYSVGQREQINTLTHKKMKSQNEKHWLYLLFILTLISLYILRELELRIKYRSWKFPEGSPNPRMLRSSLNFIIPCLEASDLAAGGHKQQISQQIRQTMQWLLTKNWVLTQVDEHSVHAGMLLDE